MREDNVRIFLGLLLHCVDISEAYTENDIASVACELVDSLLNLLIIFRHIVNDKKILCRIKSHLLHAFGNTMVMSIGITCSVILAVDVDRAYLKVRSTASPFISLCRTAARKCKYRCYCKSCCD